LIFNKKQMMKKFIMSLLWMATFANAQAQNMDAELRQYFKAIGLEKKMKAELEFQLEQTAILYQTREVTQPRLDSISKAIQMSYQELENEMIAVYKLHFNPKEVKALTQFYESPVGQKQLQIETTLKIQSHDATTAWSQKIEDKISMAFYGMTAEAKRQIDWDNAVFADKVFAANDSLTMMEFATTIDTLLKYFKEKPSDVTLKKRLANQYNNFAWYQLMVNQYDKAEQNLQLGLKVDATNVFLYTNLPLCYLLQGKYEAAKKLYLEFKEKPYDQNGAPLYKDVFLKDLRRFQTANIIPAERLADVEKIKTLLNEAVVGTENRKPVKK
jgi:uncharacterized protein